MTFSVFYLIEIRIRRGTFCWKPHLNQTSGSKVIAIERFSKQQKCIPFSGCISQPMFPTSNTDPTRSQHICDLIQNISCYLTWQPEHFIYNCLSLLKLITKTYYESKVKLHLTLSANEHHNKTKMLQSATGIILELSIALFLHRNEIAYLFCWTSV